MIRVIDFEIILTFAKTGKKKYSITCYHIIITYIRLRKIKYVKHSSMVNNKPKQW